jgi:hypothetical protein
MPHAAGMAQNPERAAVVHWPHERALSRPPVDDGSTFAACVRAATLGAHLYQPIIVDIFVITVAIGPAFALTRVITDAMLAANLYLLFWGRDR